MIAPRVSIIFGLLSYCWARSQSAQRIVTDLHAKLSAGSEVVLASDAAYASNFTARFEISAPPTYSVGVKPALITDVQVVVQYALASEVPFLATGGGHGYSWSLQTMQGGIDLDLGNFQGVEIDTVCNTMTVGGATRFEDITPLLQAAGREFPVGSCPTVGIGGWSLGGGVGTYGGIHGAGSDSLLSVEMVTGTGEILNVSATSHPDLFYGLRGAGFNYGVVTSLQFRIYPATNNGLLTVVNTIFPASLNGSVWELAAAFAGNQPAKLTLDFSVGWNSTMGGIALTCSFYYIGPQDEGLELIQPFLDLEPLNVEILTATYDNLSSVALYGEEALGSLKGVTIAPYAVNLYKIDTENIISVVNYMNATMTEDEDLRIALLAWKQISSVGFSQYSVDSSAFPWRDVVVWLQYDGFGSEVNQSAALAAFGVTIRDMAQKGSGSSNLTTYVNFAHGDEGPEAWYTNEKLPYLRYLKEIYDPENVFRYYNPVISA